MVVILLLTPHTFNGCDGGSNESSTLSTTSTGATAIPTNLYTSYQKKRSHNEIPAQSTYLPAHPQHHHNSSQHPASCNRCTNNKIVHLPTCHWPTSNICTCHYTYDNQNKNPVRTYISCYPTTQHNAAYQNLKSYQYNVYTPDKQLSLPSASSSLSPTPPPLPKSKPPYELYYNSRQRDGDGYHRVNAVPKPPRCQQRSTHQRIQITTNNNKDKNCLPDNCLRTIPAVCRKNANKENIFNYLGNLPKQSRKIPSSSKNTSTNTTDYVRHVTRVNFYDIDTLQVEFEPKDDDAICDTEAITKEEEWVTKRKTELTTTRQIETRVKRQVVLKDGKVVGDSGPIVSTNTTEDTDKQETETTEKKDFGQPNNHVSVTASTQGAIEDAGTSRQLAVPNENVIKKLLPRPADGLLRETKEKRVISREEVKDYLETEAVQHLGDFSDENYIKAINNSTDNLEETLLTAGNQKHLVPTGPKVIANTSKSYKTIDTEDTEKRCFARPDGTLVTENKNTTEHEVIADEDLPEKDNQLEGPSHELTKTVEARQRFYKQRDEQNVDILANGKLIGTEMRYAAETMQIEKDGSLERPGDWDSLSDRMRKLRKPQKTLLQQQKEAAALMADRKDALTKRPLDFDREEETRKGETMKWLESHFGSESTASNDSRDETEVEPTKRTYFNVTIKSNYAQNESQTATAAANLYDKKYHQQQKETDIIHMGASGSAGKTKYYQGISNWIDRKNSQPPTNHFATKAFRDDLKETVERNRLKRVDIKTNSREQLYTGGGIGEGQHLPEPKDTYVSREDILNQKRQSLSSQFLARTKRGSLNTADLQNQVDSKLDYRSGSHTDIRYVTNEHQHQRFQNNQRTNNHFRSLETAAELPVNTVGRNVDYEPTMGGRIRKSMAENSDTFDHSATSSRFLNDTLAPITLKKEPKRIPSPDPLHMQSKTLDRPKVPQRKRAVERKLRQQFSAPPESTIVFDHFSDRAEPPPDYSPPPRSRSASPQIDYITSSEGRDIRTDTGGNNTVNTTRKLNQRTRFAPTHPSDLHQSRPKMSTQTTQTTPSTISSASATTSHKSHNKVGQAIGNSLRKLVGKIRSASAERMFRMKSKSKSREQSPSTLDNDKEVPNANSTTYQQYNLIDSHIGSGGQTNGHESEQESAKLSPQQSYMITSSNTNLSTVRRDAPTSMRSISGSTTLNRDKPKAVNRDETTEDFYENQRDIDAVINPRQRYYLGEDPYSSKLYGKENMYDPTSVGKRYREHEPNPVRRNNMENFEKRNDKEREPYTHNRYTTSNTLGRYQKSSQRLVGSTPNLSNDYRTAKTLPRKLADHQEYQHPQQQIMGSSQLDGLVHYQPTTVGPGPAKPVRSYTKVLNRSKSFNLHGLNGSTENNNTPIYMGKSNEKQRINAMANSNTNLSYAYKREPTYLSNSYKDNTLQQSGLKSPSIVNLISRSQKDLTKIGSIEDENEFIDKYDVRDTSNTRRLRSTEQNEKKNIFLRGLHQQAPDLFKTLHGDEDLRLQHTSKISSAQRKYPLKVMHSVEPRSPIQINKDTASIIRGSIYETDPYVSPQSQPLTLANKEKVHLYGEDQKRRGSGSTVIEINRK